MFAVRALSTACLLTCAALPALGQDVWNPAAGLPLSRAKASAEAQPEIELVAARSRMSKYGGRSSIPWSEDRLASREVRSARQTAPPPPEPMEEVESPLPSAAPHAVLDEPCETCDDCGDSGCGGCGTCCDCCPFWAHRTGLFGEFLLLKARGDDMAHAFQRNGSVPRGDVGTVDQDYESGFRAGFSLAMEPCSSVSASFTRFDSHNTDLLVQGNVDGDEARSLVLHPGFVNAGTSAQELAAEHDIDFQLIDLEYSRVLQVDCNHVFNWTLGVRYGNLEQNFAQLGAFAQPTGDILTITDIDFNGLGLRAGLDARRRMCGGWSTFGKLFVSALAGDVHTTFENFNVTTDTTLAAVDWSDNRLVPMMEYEVGLAWTSAGDRWRVSAGYYTLIWFNLVTTPEYVQAVQNDSFVDLGDSVTFDGLTVKIERRF